jgi:hypothetical protein
LIFFLTSFTGEKPLKTSQHTHTVKTIQDRLTKREAKWNDKMRFGGVARHVGFEMR